MNEVLESLHKLITVNYKSNKDKNYNSLYQLYSSVILEKCIEILYKKWVIYTKKKPYKLAYLSQLQNQDHTTWKKYINFLY